MSVEKDPKDGIAHVKGCYVWRIMRITRDVGLRADWYEAVHKVYPHLTRDDITDAFAYSQMEPSEIEALIKQSYEDDGTAQKYRDRQATREQETLKALDSVREGVLKLKMGGAEPGAIYLAHPASWYLNRHSIAQALGHEFDPDMPDELYGIPIVRAGKRSFIISDCRFTSCVFLDAPLRDPHELMGMSK